MKKNCLVLIFMLIISLVTSTGLFADRTGPVLNVSSPSNTWLYYQEGHGPSYPASFTVSGSDLAGDITISASTNCEISLSSSSGYTLSSLTLNHVEGTVAQTTVYVRSKAGLQYGWYGSEAITITSPEVTDQTVSFNVEVDASNPVITVSPATLSGFSYIVDNGPSPVQSFVITYKCAENIYIETPDDYEVSFTENSGYSDSYIYIYPSYNHTVVSRTIYVRLKSGLEVGEYNNESIDIISYAGMMGYAMENCSCSGEVGTIEIPAPAVNIFPADGSADLPRIVTLSWQKGTSGDDPTGFKVYQGETLVSTIPYVSDILYYQQLDQVAWDAAVSWKIVPYNDAGNCDSAPVWTFDVMADPGGTPPAQVVYYQLPGVTVTEPPTITLPPIILGGEAVQPTVDFTFDSAPASFTLAVTVQDQPNNPVPSPENCGGALLANFPGGNQTRVVFYFSTTITPDAIHHWNGSSWVDITAVCNPVFSLGQIAFDWISPGRSEDQEEFVVNNGDGALPVTLSSFTTTFSEGSALLTWSTLSECNNLGWNVYRSETEEFADGSLHNEDLIEGAGTTTQPSDYSFTDSYPAIEGLDYWFWIESISFSGQREIFGPAILSVPNTDPEQNTPIIPELFGLYQNYPNPFNPSTEISFALQEAADCELVIYDVKGRIVKKLFAGNIEAERIYSFTWNGEHQNGKSVSSGIYFYKMKSGNYQQTKKMILMK